MPGLLYPAYQKFYSAICNIKRFCVENNFFDNISSLDAFFSEYRSTTLVMQESLAHTPYSEIYKNVSEGIWDPFFNNQRVKSIHIHPVEFTKEVTINVYFPNSKINVLSQTFSVENDVPLNTLINSLKDFFKSINPVEVFFSAKFSFVEKDSGVDLWDKVVEGISTMQNFMDTMYSKIGESCPLCDKLRTEIEKAGLALIPKDFFSVVDYAYYPLKDEFERAGRIAMIMTGTKGKTINREKLKYFMSSFGEKHIKSPFEKFVMMHAIIRNVNIMPAVMVVYNDDTYDIDAFHADIKTTVYRKINETAEHIQKDDVREIYFMTAYSYCEYVEDNFHITSKERATKAFSECLAFMKVDNELNEAEYVFDGKLIRDMTYIACNIKNGRKDKLDFGSHNMRPIIDAFKTKKQNNINMGNKHND